MAQPGISELRIRECSRADFAFVGLDPLGTHVLQSDFYLSGSDGTQFWTHFLNRDDGDASALSFAQSLNDGISHGFP
ncbi:hypothetical protein [Bradyrhizobium sp. 5.13L]